MGKRLFTPITIGSVTIPNRTVFLAHETGLAEEGLPSQRDAAYYEARARGGVGLIVGPASMIVHPNAWNPMYVRGFDPDVVPKLQEIADSVHRHGTKIFGQLQHTGGEASGTQSSHELWAPSAVPSDYGCEMPKSMEREDIEELKLGFVKSASHVKEGGLDGLELKVGHDGILRQFLSPKYNRRDDVYGGSVENRVRLVNEVVESIRNRVGDEFPIGIRLTLDEMEVGGYDFGEAVKIIQNLTTEFDYLDSDIATISKLHITDAPMHAPIAYAEEYYGGARAEMDVPVIAAGRINDLTKANNLLEEGRADMIGMCRQLICDPNTVRKVRNGMNDEVVHCIACNQNCLGGIYTNGHVGCIQTPRSGRETKIASLQDLEKPPQSKRCLVIGGGPAGLSFAVTAAELGHDVFLKEKEERLGGQSNIAKQIDSRREFGDAVRNFLNRLENRPVDVETGVEVGKSDIDADEWDEIIIATGATEQEPEFEGKNVVRSWDVLQGAPTGDTVLVFDKNKHAAGVGVAEQLAKEYHEVTLVTTSYHPGDRLEGTNVPPFLESLHKHDVEIVEHNTIIAFEDQIASAMNVYSEEIQQIQAETLVVAERREARTDLGRSLADSKFGKKVHRIGDCQSPRLIDKAIYEGEMLARRL